jgi:hypothetical protein
MRTSLLHPKRADRRHPRRERGRHPSAIFAPDTAEVVAVAGQAETGGIAPAADAQARQVRAAGGPLDRASYTCGCGYVFLAAVTTTVQCPHCGDAQAW